MSFHTLIVESLLAVMIFLSGDREEFEDFGWRN